MADDIYDALVAAGLMTEEQAVEARKGVAAATPEAEKPKKVSKKGAKP